MDQREDICLRDLFYGLVAEHVEERIELISGGRQAICLLYSTSIASAYNCSSLDVKIFPLMNNRFIWNDNAPKISPRSFESAGVSRFVFFGGIKPYLFTAFFFYILPVPAMHRVMSASLRASWQGWSHLRSLIRGPDHSDRSDHSDCPVCPEQVPSPTVR